MMVLAYNPSNWEVWQDYQEFQAILSYIVKLISAWATVLSQKALNMTGEMAQ